MVKKFSDVFKLNEDMEAGNPAPQAPTVDAVGSEAPVDAPVETPEVKDISEKIVDYFKSNPDPQDSAIHKMAEELGMEADALETEIYKVLSGYINNADDQE